MKIRKISFFRMCVAALVIVSLATTFVPGSIPVPQTANPAADVKPASRLEFEANRGQFPQSVQFFARGPGANIMLRPAEAMFLMRATCGEAGVKCDDSLGFALRMQFVGAAPDAPAAGEAETPHITNYLKGSPEDFVTGVPNYSRIRMSNVYQGIDVVWHGLDDGAARYDFIVAPDADPGQISLRFDGADSVSLDGEGNLVIETPFGQMHQARPVTFQEHDGIRSEVQSSFRIEPDLTVRFDVGEYDRSRPLTIDPTVTINYLAFSTLLGSFGDDAANDIAVDSNGNSYITGKTTSTTFPTTAGTFDTSPNGAEDVFVAKFNSSGTGLLFSTYIGGTFYDEGTGIAVGPSGDIYIAGNAGVSFPTTAGAFDTTYNGGSDAFVARLSANGSSLIYSTYLGASQNDTIYDLALDSGGNTYIAVRTFDAIVDFPTTAGAFDTTHNGSDDVAIAKINQTGTALVYSTFLGGSGIDVPTSVAVNSVGEVYVGGVTTDDTTDFPTTAGAYDTTVNGVTDFFITRINPAGSGLIFSTVIGGSDIDNASGLAIDEAGNAYITGNASAGFPTTAGVFDTISLGGDGAVAKVSADGSTLLYSTFYGGTQNEVPNGIAVDRFGFAYITGTNFGGDLPTTSGAFDTTANGSSDGFLAMINQNASALTYSTYFGGGGVDAPFDVALDQKGNVYLAGRSVLAGSPYPTSNEAYQTLNAGAGDAFVTKFGDFAIGGKVIDATTGNPLANVMVALSGQVSDFVLTGSDGRFGFLDTVPGEPHSVSATRSGYAINPAVFNIAGLASNRELIFVATVGSPTGGSGGTLRFQNVSYNKAENGGSIAVTVSRIGQIQTNDPVTVDFTTVDGSATAGADFQPASGVLTFGPLETSKTILIPIVNDSELEPKETFSITLSNPTNNADIETGHGSTVVQVLDEDVSAGDLLISEFRERGRLGPHDEYVKLFNPNDFDVTIQTGDGSPGLTVAYAAAGLAPVPVATIPNQVTIGARGHYLLTNNNPNGGFSLIDYPTGNGNTTSVGDQTFSADIPDNAAVILLKTADPTAFTAGNAVDKVGFGASEWSEGKGLPAIVGQNSEMSFVRRLTVNGVQDSESNLADFMLVDNRATGFETADQMKLFSVLGAPAPESTESLRFAGADRIQIAAYGSESYDPAPVQNGAQGSLTVYRTITNLSSEPISALRLRAANFPVYGSELSRRYSSRPDFRLTSSGGDVSGIRSSTLAASRLQPNGGGLNSTLTIDSVTPQSPLMPGETIVVAIKFTVMRYGRHPLELAAEVNY